MMGRMSFGLPERSAQTVRSKVGSCCICKDSTLILDFSQPMTMWCNTLPRHKDIRKLHRLT